MCRPPVYLTADLRFGPRGLQGTYRTLWHASASGCGSKRAPLYRARPSREVHRRPWDADRTSAPSVRQPDSFERVEKQLSLVGTTMAVNCDVHSGHPRRLIAHQPHPACAPVRAPARTLSRVLEGRHSAALRPGEAHFGRLTLCPGVARGMRTRHSLPHDARHRVSCRGVWARPAPRSAA